MWTEAFETEKTRGISVKLSKGLVSFQEKRCISVKRKREREREQHLGTERCCYEGQNEEVRVVEEGKRRAT